VYNHFKPRSGESSHSTQRRGRSGTDKGKGIVRFYPDQIPEEDKENSETDVVQDSISSGDRPQSIKKKEKENEVVRFPPDEMSGNEETDSDSDPEYLESEDEDVGILATMRPEDHENLPTVFDITEEQMMEFQKMWDAGKKFYDENLAKGISYSETGQMLFRELAMEA